MDIYALVTTTITGIAYIVLESHTVVLQVSLFSTIWLLILCSSYWPWPELCCHLVPLACVVQSLKNTFFMIDLSFKPQRLNGFYNSKIVCVLWAWINTHTSFHSCLWFSTGEKKKKTLLEHAKWGYSCKMLQLLHFPKKSRLKLRLRCAVLFG